MSKGNEDFFKSKSRWSQIKDQLLGCYLRPYFQKVLTTGQPIFYVDCFAGKGKFDDGNPGSPLIALKARDECLSRTSGNGRIDMCFIDLNYAKELGDNLASLGYDCKNLSVVPGKYEEKIEGLLSNKRGTNVFLYIDPYGIKALDSALFDKFQALGFRTLEMLINFNSFGFFRDACRVMRVDYSDDEALKDLDDLVEYEPTPVSASSQSERLLTGIAGDDYWKAIVRDYQAKKIDGYQAEKRLSREYKQRLRQRYKYVLDMPIRLKAGLRPKYRMIHVSDHEDGCFLMAQNMQKRKDELFIQVQQGGQRSLFDADTRVSSTVENELMTAEQIKAVLLEHLSTFFGDVGLTSLLATFVNNHGLLCEFGMIYAILDELKKDGFIEIERIPATTAAGKERMFWQEGKGRKVIIRRRRYEDGQRVHRA